MAASRAVAQSVRIVLDTSTDMENPPCTLPQFSLGEVIDPLYLFFFPIKGRLRRAAWGTQSVEHSTLDFGSAHALTVYGDGAPRGAWDNLSPHLPLLARPLAKQINKH